MHCTGSSSVKAAGVKLAQGFQHLIAHVERMGVEECTALLPIFWSSENDLPGVFDTRQKVTAWPAAKADLARSASGAERSDAGKDGLFTDFDGELSKLSTESAAQRRVAVYISSQDGLGKVLFTQGTLVDRKRSSENKAGRCGMQ